MIQADKVAFISILTLCLMRFHSFCQQDGFFITYFRYFDTRPHTARSRNTSLCQNLPNIGGTKPAVETPTTIPVVNEDSRQLLQQGGAFYFIGLIFVALIHKITLFSFRIHPATLPQISEKLLG